MEGLGAALRKRWMLVGGAGLLLFALTTGLVENAVIHLVRSDAQRQLAEERAPFELALYALAAAPEAHYQDTVAGAGQVDVRVTNHGELIGTVSEAGQSYALLRVAGKSYVKLPASGLPAVTNPAQTAALQDKWLTGRELDTLLGSAPAQLLAPKQLAGRLATALSAARTLPPVGDPGTRLDGVAVLSVQTPAGVLSVTRAAPHRVVRLASAPGAAVRSAHVLRGVPRAVVEAVSASPDDLDLAPEQPGDIASTYSQLEDDTRQLSTAIDSDLQFDLQGSGQINCGDAGCSVTVTVSSSVSAGGSGATITGGSVAAVLTATVNIEGQAAGGCTGAGQLPLNGTGTIGCADPGAGGVFASVDAEKKAAADAQSEAEGGASVPYTISYGGESYVYATAQVDVARLVSNEGHELADDQQNACRYSTIAVPVVRTFVNNDKCGPDTLNYNQIRRRIQTHVEPRHGYGTPAAGTKFAKGIGEDEMFQKLVEGISPDNATGKVNLVRDAQEDIEPGNHQHVLEWPGAGAAGENYVEVWITPDGQLGGMWPIVAPPPLIPSP